MNLVIVKIDQSGDTSFIFGQPHRGYLGRIESRGILGVVDGFSPKGIEDEGEIGWGRDFLRHIGYKQ